MVSLGREPQDWVKEKDESREAATDTWPRRPAAHAAAPVCRPFGASIFFACLYLGLTPQAKYISPPSGARSLFDSSIPGLS
jgi:hypothetical protein